MCYQHNAVPAVYCVQGETDSMGCEYIFMCEACKAESDQELQKLEAYDEYVRNFPLHDPRD